MKRIFYIAIFHEENNQYWVSFPDFPECFTQGNSIEEAFSCAQEALELCIEERIVNNERLPKPTIMIDDKSGQQVLLSCECDENLVAA